MFEPSDTARLFGLAPGIDFPRALVEGLLARMQGQPPEALARITLIVNTARMRRRLQQLFSEKSAMLMPRMLLVTDLDLLDPSLSPPAAVPALQRRLELISLVSSLLDTQDDLAPRSSLYALTDSLAALMDEMQGEGVTLSDLERIDVTDQSGHWQRALQFIKIAQNYVDDTTSLLDKEARNRLLVTEIAKKWQADPLRNPVILAGSTGSRGTTMLLMEAVAKLPRGAIVLPGFDFAMPTSVWADLDNAMLSEDHPQFRFHKLMTRLGQTRNMVTPWTAARAPSEARNALVSLSLRPAPVTDAWLSEGVSLKDIDTATADMTLLNAPSPRIEALTIAMRLRQAIDEGKTAALITPDRMLTRQVTAALDQWGILPDDSAGSPLHLSPPGRFLRHVARLFHHRLDAEALLTLLKHPLTHSGVDRNLHVLNTQRLELRIRDKGLPYPDADNLPKLMQGLVQDTTEQEQLDAWVHWVGQTITTIQAEEKIRPLESWVSSHISLSETISNGLKAIEPGELWLKKAGIEARKVMQELTQHGHCGGNLSASDYADLVGALLADEEVRDRDAPHPDIMIWGTLEARVQGADLVILAGLNDGIWPQAPAPDPWLNRMMRNKAGMLLPERRIGLSAHDYQQAIGAKEVWLTRSIRSEDAETVASRWLNRLCNLLAGLNTNGGPAALSSMIERGNDWLQRVETFEEVHSVSAAKRPSPRPPSAVRPRKMSVTEIKRLIRDPYAIYAKHVLRLRKLGPLVQNPDALMRGILAHEILEIFVKDTLTDPRSLSTDHLVKITHAVLDAEVPWPAARALWRARMEKVVPWFVNGEVERQKFGTPIAFEDQAIGRLIWPEIGFELTARADRIDQTDLGDVLLYDYKTGTPPSKKEQKNFDKQLLIEAAMIEGGAFRKIGPAHVAQATFIGLGPNPIEIASPLEEEPLGKVIKNLRELIMAYLDQSQGFTSRRTMNKNIIEGDYDLLARFGEWDATQDPTPEDLA